MEWTAWEELDIGEYDRLWSRFESLYGFRAHTEPEGWPAIREPVGSVTFDLAPAWVEDACGFWTTQAVNHLVVRSLACVVPEDDPIIVLDWQHPSHKFWPHRLPESWIVPELFPNGVTPCPNGDYYAFLSEDMLLGTFGHPWEQTLCVLGEQLVQALAPTLEPLLPVKRRT